MSATLQGFGPSPRTRFVYVTTDVPTGFAYFDHDAGELVPTEGDALYGRVTAISRGEKLYKGKTNHKLKIDVQAGPRTFVIETGRYTAFAKSVLPALLITQELLAKKGGNLKDTDIGMMVKILEGDDDRVALGEVFNSDTGRTVFVGDRRPQNEQDVEDIIDALVEAVGTHEYAQNN